MAFTQRCEQFRTVFQRLRDEIGRVIVGHEEIVDGVLTCLFAGGHCLLEGPPGLGKTLLVRTLSAALDMDFCRIQFTPDLMPADITGTNVIYEDEMGGRYFQLQKGPVFANVVLADEINRATPKTQSALLEAMQERSVTVGGVLHELDEPFLVMATQNPIEMEGTYPLPEAQLDRFLLKLLVGKPELNGIRTILDRTTGGARIQTDKAADKNEVLAGRGVVKEIYCAPHLAEFAGRLVEATQPGSGSPLVQQYLRYGASPRGAQALVLIAKAKALLDGRYNVSFRDIESVAPPALRHRIALNYEGEAAGIEVDDVITQIVEDVRKDVRTEMGAL